MPLYDISVDFLDGLNTTLPPKTTKIPQRYSKLAMLDLSLPGFLLTPKIPKCATLSTNY